MNYVKKLVLKCIDDTLKHILSSVIPYVRQTLGVLPSLYMLVVLAFIKYACYSDWIKKCPTVNKHLAIATESKANKTKQVTKQNLAFYNEKY